MKKNKQLPNKIPIFPLSNFIIFPGTTVPLNIFEPRYIQMINDCMNNDKIFGIIQPKRISKKTIPDLYSIGCLGKITNFSKTEDGRYLVIITGITRFKISNEIENDKLYRKCEINFEEFNQDGLPSKEPNNLKDLDLIFDDLKLLFKKKGFEIDWKNLQKQDVNLTINTLAMASPFSLEEKQALLEVKNIEFRKNKLREILKTYIFDDFENTTVQ